MRRSFPLLLAVLALSASLLAETASVARLLKQGRANEAIAAAKQQLASSDSAELHNLLMRAYYWQDATEAAIREGEKAVALEPKNSSFHLWLGRAYGQKAEKVNVFSQIFWAKRVQGQFEQAAQLDPGNVEALSDLSEYYIEAPAIMGGGHDKAAREADLMQPLDRASADWVRARIAEKEGRAADAEQLYRAALQAPGPKADRWLDLASFFRRQKRYDEMEKAVAGAVDHAGDSADALFSAAGTLITTGRNRALAAKLLHQYLDSPEQSEDAPAFQAHYLLGQLLEQQGDLQGAKAEYQASADMASDYAKPREALKRLK
jgi:tetratricopeptide (TPR) repeat protein